MNASEALDLFSNVDNTLAQQLEKLPAKQKKTAKGILECSVKLAYVLFVTGDKEKVSQLVDPISNIPFANSYDYWTWIEAALVLKGKLALAEGDREQYETALQSAVAALNSGTELQINVKANVHKRFMNGQTLYTGFEDEENVTDEFEMRLIHIMALMKIDFFGASGNWSTEKIESELSISIVRMKEILATKDIYKLAPYK